MELEDLLSGCPTGPPVEVLTCHIEGSVTGRTVDVHFTERGNTEATLPRSISSALGKNQRLTYYR
jgi:hypothetical protein